MPHIFSIMVLLIRRVLNQPTPAVSGRSKKMTNQTLFYFSSVSELTALTNFHVETGSELFFVVASDEDNQPALVAEFSVSAQAALFCEMCIALN